MPTFVSMLLEPSSGSKRTMYFPLWCGKARFVELLAREHAAMAAPFEHVDEHLVGEGVELLDLLALHVRLAGVAEHAVQAGRADARVDDAHRERDVIEERGELAGGAGGCVHSGEDVLAQGGADDGGRHGARRRLAVGHSILFGQRLWRGKRIIARHSGDELRCREGSAQSFQRAGRIPPSIPRIRFPGDGLGHSRREGRRKGGPGGFEQARFRRQTGTLRRAGSAPTPLIRGPTGPLGLRGFKSSPRGGSSAAEGGVTGTGGRSRSAATRRSSNRPRLAAGFVTLPLGDTKVLPDRLQGAARTEGRGRSPYVTRSAPIAAKPSSVGARRGRVSFVKSSRGRRRPEPRAPGGPHRRRRAYAWCAS